MIIAPAQRELFTAPYNDKYLFASALHQVREIHLRAVALVGVDERRRVLGQLGDELGTARAFAPLRRSRTLRSESGGASPPRSRSSEKPSNTAATVNAACARCFEERSAVAMIAASVNSEQFSSGQMLRASAEASRRRGASATCRHRRPS